MATPARHELRDRAPQMDMEALRLPIVDRARHPGGIETGLPQHLIGQEIANARHMMLIEQPCLERGPARGQAPP